MPVVTLQLLDLAAAVTHEALGGERASALLGSAIAQKRLGAVEAEQLASLVYGALRRQRRVRAVLRALSVSVSREIEARLDVIGAALLDAARPLDFELARSAWSEVSWQRFQATDESVIASATGATKVALLGSLPDFLARELLREYGAEAEPLAASLSESAPRSLRVNSLCADVVEGRARLESEGAKVAPARWAQRGLRFEGAFNPFVTRAFHEGLFELQDEGSQIACELVAPPPRGVVVDACAGAGGKSLGLAAALGGRGKVFSLDVDAQKLAELRRRAKRAGVVNIQPLSIEETGALPEVVQALTGKVDRLLIDAPCSGTGVLRRNPEARARLTPESITRLVATQREIVERMLPLVAPGGRLIFVTCSLLRAEGEGVMDDIEAAHPELEPVNLAEIYDRAYIERFVRSAPHRVRLLPHLHDTDGFFVSVLRRKRSN
jgi:16S rRNA (cytosine967-C5)-methyltransferase